MYDISLKNQVEHLYSLTKVLYEMRDLGTILRECTQAWTRLIITQMPVARIARAVPLFMPTLQIKNTIKLAQESISGILNSARKLSLNLDSDLVTHSEMADRRKAKTAQMIQGKGQITRSLHEKEALICEQPSRQPVHVETVSMQSLQGDLQSTHQLSLVFTMPILISSFSSVDLLAGHSLKHLF